MSFEIKYDRDRNPIKSNNPVPEEPVEQTIEAHQSSANQEVPVEEPTQETALESLVSESETVPEKQPEVELGLPEKQPRKSHQAENFRIMKEKALAAEKRAQELEQALLAAQQAQKITKQEITEDDSEFSVEADALVEGKHLSKVSQHIKKLEQQLQQYQQQSALQATEVRLKTQYPDFDNIVSKDNLDSLRIAYPEIAQTLNSSTDLYAKAVSAYTMIKRLGISESQDYNDQKELVKKNLAKPRPLASIAPQQGDSPLSRANAFASGKLTDEIKAQMLKEMIEYGRR